MTSGIAYEPSHVTLQHVVRFVLDRLNDDRLALKATTKRGDAVGVGPFTQHRVERDLEIRRDIVGVLQRMAILRDLPDERPVREHVERVIELLAAPYREHPDFDPHWDRA